MDLRSLPCLLLLLLVPASHQQVRKCSNDDPCKNQPDCSGCVANDRVPDPENCRGYYYCVDNAGVIEPSDLTFECPAGEVFDITTRSCVSGTCENNCPVVPPTGTCTYECTAGGLISSSIDCGTYYTCDGATPPGVSGSVACGPSTPFFNGEVCQTDEKLCCHCKPFCESTLTTPTVVADPLDCRKYYLCTADNVGEVPTEEGSCPEGEHFDPLLVGCSASSPCEMQLSCLNVVAPDGCIDPFTCVTTGYFARCPDQCTPDFYHCTAATGTFQTVESCTNGLVFNPDTYGCVAPSNCPY